MKKNLLLTHIQTILVTSSIALTGFASPSVTQASGLTEAITGGVPSINLRARYEGVSQEGKNDATAITERLLVGYKTGSYNGINAFVEMSDTAAIGSRKDYFVPKGPDAGGDATKAVVLDPSLTQLNQALIGYQFDNTSLIAGKQRIIFDNRFLGNVGWRQTEQVYTGLSLKSKAISNLEVDYAYILDSNNPIGVQEKMASHAIQVKSAPTSIGVITGYGYFLDYDLATKTDSQTVGARLAGKKAISDSLGLNYHLEYASQSDFADSKNIGGNYTRAEIALQTGYAKFLIGQETLGGDGKSAFQTPLGTVHLFNGWADMFIGPVGGTPVNGLVDNYFSVSGKAVGLKLAAIYHQFGADKASSKYGNEYDLLITKKFSKVYSGGIKYANYQADTHLKDTSKLWIWGQLKF